MAPIVSIVGKSKSGKTTLVEKIIKELKSRSYRIASVKHVPQEYAFDTPDKDSWRHIQAGSGATIIRSPDTIILIKPATQPFDLDELGRLLGEDYDIILAEGFKEADAPKIEVHRKAIGTPLANVRRLAAIVTDEPLESSARQFSFDDIKGLADLLERGFIRAEQEKVILYINNIPVHLSAFPREIISNTLVAMASSLKGAGDIQSLDIHLRKQSGND
jgi:molybdopterin-guanine dinucleotide biosynthesis protein B